MDEVLRELHPDEWIGYFRGVQPLWGGGLPEEPFVAFQRRLARSREAEGRYRLFGYVSASGELLSAFKAYELRGGLPNGHAAMETAAKELRLVGIGAVFTPPKLRGSGYASRMLRLALDHHARSGFDAALLFSDIGAPFYEKLGFRALESTECLVPAKALPRASGAQPAGPGDEDIITAVLAGSRPGTGLSLHRDGWILRFQLRRLRELARARAVGEPEWGLRVEGPAGEAAALVRLARDAVDLLDAAWTSEEARVSLFGGLRECLSRCRRQTLRLWPAHQLRGLYPVRARPSALSMVAPLGGATLPGPGGRAELTLLDHI